MKRPLGRRIVELAVLVATAVCLVGHGGGLPPSCFLYEGQSASYNATGTCGPAGVITVTQAYAFCKLQVTGDNVGLPSNGDVTYKLGDGFLLSGSLDADWDMSCTSSTAGSTDAGISVAGGMTVACSRRPSASNPMSSTADVPYCQEHLVPLTKSCDLHACPTPTCAAGQHTELSQTGCCAVCVDNGPDDVIPGPLPTVCHPETCSHTCPAGQEMAVDGGACCGWCQTVPQECVDGRAAFKSELSAKWQNALSCSVDADCIVTVVGGPCGSSCLDAIARSEITPISEWAYFRSKELCGTCFNAPAATDCPATQIIGATCRNGVCVPQVLPVGDRE